jgi:hypothetical protein
VIGRNAERAVYIRDFIWRLLMVPKAEVSLLKSLHATVKSFGRR